MRSDVIGDFHDPYGAALLCGIRFAFLFYIPVIINRFLCRIISVPAPRKEAFASCRGRYWRSRPAFGAGLITKYVARVNSGTRSPASLTAALAFLMVGRSVKQSASLALPLSHLDVGRRRRLLGGRPRPYFAQTCPYLLMPIGSM